MTDRVRVLETDRTLINLSIGATLEDVGEEIWLNGNSSRLNFELENTHATVALSDFSLMGKAHADGTYVNIITGAGWAAAVGSTLLFKSADINTLAATAKATLMVDVSGWYKIKFQAKTGTSGSATIRPTLSRQ